jgi:hypothetical protein
MSYYLTKMPLLFAGQNTVSPAAVTSGDGTGFTWGDGTNVEWSAP